MRHINYIINLLILALVSGSIFTSCKDDFEDNFYTLPVPYLSGTEGNSSNTGNTNSGNTNSGNTNTEEEDLAWESTNKGQSSSVSYNEYTITDVRAGAVLTFEYYVSSESYDYLNVYIYPSGNSYSDTYRVLHVSGTTYTTFRTFSYTFSEAGDYEMRVEYKKDSSVDTGEDRAAVRNFNFTNGPEESTQGETSSNYGQNADGTYWWTSPATDNGHVSWHTWNLTISKVGATLKFDYRVSSESNYDFLNVYIYPASQESSYSSYRILHESGTTYSYFRTYNYTFTATGSYIMRAEYSKDGSTIAGEDKAWIQNLGFLSSSSVKGETPKYGKTRISERNIYKISR
ncbi:MAG: hypothetical protein K6F94_05070 [Bacteroidaceae bacterium]|nr:hypothetical protein [Bacteroidaceae bacterium]